MIVEISHQVVFAWQGPGLCLNGKSWIYGHHQTGDTVVRSTSSLFLYMGRFVSQGCRLLARRSVAEA
jgi:hypothetical protein